RSPPRALRPIWHRAACAGGADPPDGLRPASPRRPDALATPVRRAPDRDPDDGAGGRPAAHLDRALQRPERRRPAPRGPTRSRLAALRLGRDARGRGVRVNRRSLRARDARGVVRIVLVERLVLEQGLREPVESLPVLL